MIRYLKALGLAMIAAFAFSALSAASASAQETPGHLTSESTEVTLTGEEASGEGAGLNAFTAFGSEVQCPGATYTGHKLEATPHEPLHSGETAVTVTPHYEAHAPCNNGGAGSREIDMNSCDFEFYDFTTTEGDDTYGFDIDIACEGDDEITITGAPFGCVVHVPPQKGLTGLHATNEAGGKVRLSGEVTGITARLPCLGAHTENAVQHQDVVVTGDDPETGKEVGISISD